MIGINNLCKLKLFYLSLIGPGNKSHFPLSHTSVIKNLMIIFFNKETINLYLS